jgi:hypothetical protein
MLSALNLLAQKEASRFENQTVFGGLLCREGFGADLSVGVLGAVQQACFILLLKNDIYGRNSGAHTTPGQARASWGINTGITVYRNHPKTIPFLRAWRDVMLDPASLQRQFDDQASFMHVLATTSPAMNFPNATFHRGPLDPHVFFAGPTGSLKVCTSHAVDLSHETYITCFHEPKTTTSTFSTNLCCAVQGALIVPHPTQLTSAVLCPSHDDSTTVSIAVHSMIRAYGIDADRGIAKHSVPRWQNLL